MRLSLATLLLVLVSSCSGNPAFADDRQLAHQFLNSARAAHAVKSRPAHKVASRHKTHREARQSQRQAVVAGRPSACPSRAWCGCWLAQHLGMSNRTLWLARAWARVGSPASGPAPGVIAVWPHHVGIVTAVTGSGRAVILSGNDGRAVRERERSTAGVIAWRYVGRRYASR